MDVPRFYDSPFSIGVLPCPLTVGYGQWERGQKFWGKKSGVMVFIPLVASGSIYILRVVVTFK